MPRTLGLPRLAAGLVVFPFAVLLGAACGGTDIIDSSDASSADDASHDGAALDARGSDSGSDTGSGSDGGSDSGTRDGGASLDAGRDADAAVGDGGSITLGRAGTFAILAGQGVAITATAGTTISGDVGVSPGTAIATLPAGQPSPGTVFAGGTVAANAQSDLTTAYNTLGGLACGTNLTAVDLGGKTLLPGVYCFNSSAQLTGALVLDANNDPNATWVIQIGSTLTTGTGASVSVIRGGSACRVYWQVRSSATFGTGTQFLGNVVALASITMVTGANILTGRALARNADVNLDGNKISNAGCP
jgi:hypothetical protein